MIRYSFSEAEESDMVARFKAGEGAQGIAKSYGCGTGRPVVTVLRKYGAFEPDRKFKGRYSDEQKQAMIDRYRAGESVQALARDFGCDRGNVRVILVRRGVTIRELGIPVDPAIDEQIRQMRGQEMSVREIALALNLPKDRVMKRCRAMGLSGPMMPRGPKSSLWKGGKIFRHGSGYMHVWVHPDDPMRPMCSQAGYTGEHRLVMARSLGRPLTRSESVHHINGNRADNRLENLQLRKGNHGKGVVMACLDCGSHNVGPVPIAD